MRERFRQRTESEENPTEKHGNFCWICRKNRKTRKIRGMKICYICLPGKSGKKRGKYG